MLVFGFLTSGLIFPPLKESCELVLNYDFLLVVVVKSNPETARETL